MSDTAFVPRPFTPAFEPWSKIHRWSREWIITEKLDGTNGVVHINDDSSVILAGSRNRWLTPAIPGDGKSKANDNYGFAQWVHDNQQELLKLGPGYHYGEWWGADIARRYGLTEKRFSLFNATRWADGAKEVRPSCCSVVPILTVVPNPGHITGAVAGCMEILERDGSIAAPGFMKPEGIVIFHTASRVMFKKTLENDSGKGPENRT